MERSKLRATSTFRAWRRDPWYRSRTTHAAAVSMALHVVVVLLLAYQWIHRPVPEEKPLWKEPAEPIQLAFLSAEVVTRAVATEEGPVSTQEASTAPIPSVPTPSAPKPQRQSTPPPQPKPPKQTVPPPVRQSPPKPAPTSVPPARPVASVVDLLRPEETPLSRTPAPKERDLQPFESAATPETPQAEESPPAAQAATADADAESASTGADLTPEGRRRATIGRALREIAGQVMAGGGPEAVDVVFLLDVSGSMENNIRAVADNLQMLMDLFRSRGYDATFGLVKFAIVTVRVFPQTRDAARYVRLLQNMKVGGDERALDALQRAMRRVRFRSNAQHRFVLITDEPLKGSISLLELLPRLREAGIVVDVIGIDAPDHRLLASGTGGLWFLIPGGIESNMSYAQ